jgi:hypothetical protein
MAQPVIQASFNSGEWAPSLNARVDIQKYHSAAALMENFFVDYRGGASSRPGTKYILQARVSNKAVRLIPFQASFTVSYILEFGDFYIRFYNNGAPVLEGTKAITGATQASPCVLTVVAHGYTTGDTIFVSSVAGMTQLNGRYFNVIVTGANTLQLFNLNGAAIDSSAYTAYSAGGTTQRVYLLQTAYAAADLAKLKFAQNVNQLVLVHPNYVPAVLALITATNWTISAIVFGSTIPAPTGISVATTLGAGAVNYSYTVTAVDPNGQESPAGTPFSLASKLDLRTTAGTNNVTWSAVSGAVSYNVYKAEPSYSAVIPGGAAYGYIGNATGVALADSNIAPDFSISPPIPENPFQGAGVASYNVTVAGAYATVPGVTIAAPPAGGVQATAQASLGVTVSTFNNAGSGYAVNQIVSMIGVAGGPILCTVQILTIGGGGVPLTYSILWVGSIISGAAPAIVGDQAKGGATQLLLNTTWGVTAVQSISGGAGYATPPGVTFSAGAAAATAVLAPASAGNPSAVTFFQQRLVLAAPPGAPQTFYMSQPGSYYNYNISNPIEGGDAITGSIVAGQLNEIKSMISVPTGLMVLTSQANWLVNGGAGNNAITPADATANAHSYVGASDIPPIVSNFDILFVQSKGSVVRDLTYNFYAAIFTGTDITVLSSHLFYNYTLTEWAWAQEPFKIVWAVRNDGVLLSLTFVKEQEFIGWAHHITPGQFASVATVTEQVSTGSVDAVYVVVKRLINGVNVQYIERFTERVFPNGLVDTWCVDAGLQYVGAPATTFTGAEHLAGATVFGLADGVLIPAFIMPTSGIFTLGAPASKVTVGLGFAAKLQTLILDTGEPTIQSKMKVIPSVTVRVQDTLGLSIGRSFASAVVMKDLVMGNVGSMTNAQVTGLVTGDARTILDASYTVPGQYCIQQLNPYPATILGVMPEVSIGNTAKAKQR